MQHIRTKWHHITSIIDADRVYLSCAKGAKAEHWSRYGGDELSNLRRFLEAVKDLPKFTIASELVDLAKKSDYELSMLDMKRAGVLRFPYPALVMEWHKTFEESARSAHQIVILRDMQHDGQFEWEMDEVANFSYSLTPDGDRVDRPDYYGYRMSIERDQEGDYLVVSPSLVFMSIERGPGNNNDVFVDNETFKARCVKSIENVGEMEPWVRISAFGAGVFPWTDALNELVSTSFQNDAGSVFRAAIGAYLTMNTAGVEREVIDTTRVNRTRDGVSKPHIPKHTYIHIGRVYRSDSPDAKGEAYVPGRSPRPHWRRGHTRGVRHGAQRALIKQMYFPGRLVAWNGVGPAPQVPSYSVVR